MENQAFKFSSAPQNRCALSGPGLVITIQFGLKKLEVICPDGTTHSYPLVVDGAPCPQALFLSGGSSQQMHVGTVDFYGAPQFVMDYPLNEQDIKIEFSTLRYVDHIGSLDIRDIGKVIIYDFSIVPITLSILGNHLRVATREYDEDLGLPAWYTTQPLTPQP
jgi:hypothetical protein